MIALAYLADYAEGEVIFRDAELAEYRWVTYDELNHFRYPLLRSIFELAHQRLTRI
jgi:NADH pyrophosphatase NudC (nudix superfamily)